MYICIRLGWVHNRLLHSDKGLVSRDRLLRWTNNHELKRKSRSNCTHWEDTVLQSKQYPSKDMHHKGRLFLVVVFLLSARNVEEEICLVVGWKWCPRTYVTQQSSRRASYFFNLLTPRCLSDHSPHANYCQFILTAVAESAVSSLCSWMKIYYGIFIITIYKGSDKKIKKRTNLERAKIN